MISLIPTETYKGGNIILPPSFVQQRSLLILFIDNQAGLAQSFHILLSTFLKLLSVILYHALLLINLGGSYCARRYFSSATHNSSWKQWRIINN
jgi:hypothetical protein